MKVNTFSLNQLIIHRVPDKKAGTATTGPELSQATGTHSNEVRAYFQRRLRGVMGERGQDVRVAKDGDKRASDAVKEVLDDQKRFVARSQALAQLLYDAQDGRSSAGILVVGLGTLDGQPAVGLLKLEHERGVQARERQNQQGQTFFEVVIHDDLMLTDRTQVFKAAVFRYRSAAGKSLVGQAADRQVERNVASYFLGKFLGCELAKNPALQTEQYFGAVESFLGKIDDPERRARCEIALLNQMHSSQVKSIDPVSFANTVLGTADHQPFLDHLTEHDVPHSVFPKNTSSISGRIRRVAYDFQSGIRLMGEPEAMNEHVTIAKPNAPGPRVTIDDEITDVKARG